MSHEEGHVLAGRYRLEERIAVGGMGEVWRAHDDTLDREVAVKLLRPESSSDETFLERVRAEARHAGGLTHPNVGTVHDYGEDGGNAYLVMELLEGQPLSDIIRERAPMDPAEVTEILHQTAIALQAAHEAGVVHRDVKPANIVVDVDGYAKITDFGIARALGEAPMTQTGEVLGTPHYLAPEQAKGQPAGPLSDVYALAVVGYEMLTGRRPFSGDSMVTTALAHVNQPLPPLPDTVPEPLRTTVMAALAKSPEERPDGAGAFADALRLPAGEVPAELEHGAASAVAPVVVGGPAGQAEPAQVDTRATSVLPTPTPGLPDPAFPAVVAAHTGASATQRRGARRPRWLLPAAATAVVVLVVALALVLGTRGRADTTGTQPRGIPASSTSTTRTTPATTTRTTASAVTGTAVAPTPAQHVVNGKGGKGNGKAKGGKHK
jgi:serine/threonine-protein kinase